MLEKHYRGSIKKRLRTIIVFVVFMSATLGYSLFVYWYMSNQQEKAVTLSKSVGLVLSQDFAKLLLLSDLSAASDITAKLKSFQSLNKLVLYDKANTPLYSYHKENKNFTPMQFDEHTPPLFKCENENLQIFIPALYEGIKLGHIGLNFEIDSLFVLLKRDTPFLLFLGFFMLFVSYTLAELFAKRFTAPVLKLVTFLEDIELATLSQKKIQTRAKDEFAKLYDEINEMLQRLYRAQEEQKIAAVAFETQSGMSITDANQNILRINKAFTKITGYTQEEVLGKTPKILSSGKHDKAFYEAMYDALQKKHYWSGEVYNRHKNGNIYPELLTIQAVVDETNTLKYYVAAIIDLSEQKETQKRLEFLSKFDSLTFLANKESLTQELQTHLDEKAQSGFGALLCIDFTNFKLINDAHGHSVGDEVLKLVASRLTKEFAEASMHVRMGADEFILWYKNIAQSREETALKAAEIAEDIVTLLSQPYRVQSSAIHSIPCVGITLYDSSEKRSDTLIQEANTALHLAKQEEQNNISFFNSTTKELAQKHLRLYTELLQALKEEHFELYYQAQYNHKSEVCGAEALVRWIDPKRGVVSPMEFIPIAEKTSLIIPLGEWILATAIKQLAIWQKEPRSATLTIAVNISAKQFYQEDFVSTLKELIKEHAVNAQQLKLELTESLLISDTQRVIEKMQELRTLGVGLSLDDFGTGYSSLEYLKKLPLSQIKIDQSFVKNMLQEKSDRAIIKTIISLAAAFDLELIAEGIETKEHYETLLTLGCDTFQGYYFAKPLRATEIEHLF